VQVLVTGEVAGHRRQRSPRFATSQKLWGVSQRPTRSAPMCWRTRRGSARSRTSGSELPVPCASTIAPSSRSCTRCVCDCARRSLRPPGHVGIIPRVRRNGTPRRPGIRNGLRAIVMTSHIEPKLWHDYLAPTVADAICDRVLDGAHKLALQGPARRKTRSSPQRVGSHPLRPLPSTPKKRIFQTPRQRHNEQCRFAPITMPRSI
jgi:hypothetical protein